MNGEWSIYFLQSCHPCIQYIYSREFSIGRSFVFFSIKLHRRTVIFIVLHILKSVSFHFIDFNK